MKRNLPVTQVAIEMAPGTVLVSHTDPKGIITHANGAFIEISGYSRKELIGNNHNIVRHPDVPPVLFEDLWSTIKQGRPWTGIVKNRAKSGDHYWVVANVAPEYEGGEITGYISVRRPASIEEIGAAEEIYAAAEKREVQVEAGNVYAGLGGVLKRKNPLFRMGVQQKLVLMFAILSLLPLLIFGVAGSKSAQEALHVQTTESLQAVASNKRASVEGYFKTVHDQVRTFAEDWMISYATSQFRSLYRAYREDAEVDEVKLASMRDELRRYYRQQFLQEYQNQNGTTIDVDTVVDGLGADAVALQFSYISDNHWCPNVTGQKLI